MIRLVASLVVTESLPEVGTPSGNQFGANSLGERGSYGAPLPHTAPQGEHVINGPA